MLVVSGTELWLLVLWSICDVPEWFQPAAVFCLYLMFSNCGSTWLANPGEVGASVSEALRIGYNHVDCAHVYYNEDEIGVAFNKAFSSGVAKREDIWITSKLWLEKPLRVHFVCMRYCFEVQCRTEVHEVLCSRFHDMILKCHSRHVQLVNTDCPLLLLWST